MRLLKSNGGSEKQFSVFLHRGAGALIFWVVATVIVYLSTQKQQMEMYKLVEPTLKAITYDKRSIHPFVELDKDAAIYMTKER
jgi:hypothetical protein